MAAAAITRRNFFGHVGGAYTAVALGSGATTMATGIEDMFHEWRRVASDPNSYDQYASIQSRIVSSEAQTPKELAMQIYAEMDAGQSEMTSAFWDRIVSLAAV